MNLPGGSDLPSGESEYPSIESIRTSPLLPFNEHQVGIISESDQQQQQQLVQNINEREEDGDIVLDRSMRVVDPPTNARSKQVLYAIKVLDEFLSLPSTRQIFDEILTPKKHSPKKSIKKKNRGRDHQPHDDEEPKESPAIFDNIDAIQGIRSIQAGRYEVIVKSHGKETYVFDWLCDHVWSKQVGGNNNNTVDEPLVYKSAIAMKEAILHFAVQQALRDDRITASTKNMNNISYDNFSLIVSYDPVVAQPQHIDLLYPNFQYGLIITDQSPGTTVYKSPYSIKTISDLKEHVWNDVSDTMFAAMQRNEMVTSVISQFGDVLCPNIERVQYWNAPHDDTSEPPNFCHENSTTDDDNVFLPVGTLLSLPGSEIHAGPSCSKYRTVLFFSACPDITNTIPYHPDTQYFAPLLCCDFISLLWNTIGVEDRCFLLHRLDRSITETKCRHLEQHINDANLIRFIKVITNWEKKKGKCKYTMSKYGKNYTIDQYIHAFAARGKPTSAKDIGISDVMDTRNNKKGQSTNSKTVVVNWTENVVFIDTLNRISCPDMLQQEDPVACSDDPTWTPTVNQRRHHASRQRATTTLATTNMSKKVGRKKYFYEMNATGSVLKSPPNSSTNTTVTPNDQCQAATTPINSRRLYVRTLSKPPLPLDKNGAVLLSEQHQTTTSSSSSSLRGANNTGQTTIIADAIPTSPCLTHRIPLKRKRKYIKDNNLTNKESISCSITIGKRSQDTPATSTNDVECMREWQEKILPCLQHCGNCAQCQIKPCNKCRLCTFAPVASVSTQMNSNKDDVTANNLFKTSRRYCLFNCCSASDEDLAGKLAESLTRNRTSSTSTTITNSHINHLCDRQKVYQWYRHEITYEAKKVEGEGKVVQSTGAFQFNVDMHLYCFWPASKSYFEAKIANRYLQKVRGGAVQLYSVQFTDGSGDARENVPDRDILTTFQMNLLLESDRIEEKFKECDSISESMFPTRARKACRM